MKILFKKILLITNIIIGLSANPFEMSSEVQKPEVDVQAKSRDKKGVDSPVAKVIVQENLDTKIFALLNYVFFDEGSSDIPDRYNLVSREETKEYNPYQQVSYANILDKYYDILNIVGFRMRENIALTISLTGCNSDYGVENNNIELSEQRAARIKQYLVDIWGINSERIILAKGRNLPEEPSKSSDDKSKALSLEENQRVEIKGDWDLLKPVVIVDTTISASPPVIYFSNKIKPDTNVRWYDFEAKDNNDATLFDDRDNGKPNPVITWYIENDDSAKNILIKNDTRIFYKLEVQADYHGESDRKSMEVVRNTLTTKKSLRMSSKEYSRYNLILFAYNSDEISGANDSILDFILKQEGNWENLKFFVNGYTDTIGNPESNRLLSDRRALNVANRLQKMGISKDKIITKGYGSEKIPYLNSAIENLTVVEGEYLLQDKDIAGPDINLIQKYRKTPEGRFYCRTVIIEIEKSVNY